MQASAQTDKSCSYKTKASSQIQRQKAEWWSQRAEERGEWGVGALRARNFIWGGWKHCGDGWQ